MCYIETSSWQAPPDLPVFSLGQAVCGEKPPGRFPFGATTATPATLPELFFSLIMTDLRTRQSAQGN